MNIEISIRGWQDEIEGMLSISNSNRKNKTLGILEIIYAASCVANTYLIFK